MRINNKEHVPRKGQKPSNVVRKMSIEIMNDETLPAS